MIKKLWEVSPWYIKALMIIGAPLLVFIWALDVYKTYTVGAAKEEYSDAKKKDAEIQKTKQVIEERIKKIDKAIEVDMQEELITSKELEQEKLRLQKELESIDEDWHKK